MIGATRFAPSPTGNLHVGNIRTAIMNWLAARASNRRFILRIDDTDQERSEERFVEAICDDLRWLGLDWDEIFRQSTRMQRYLDAAEALKGSGRLYACYEKPEELELRRRAQRSVGRAPVYDRAALSLSEADKKKLEAQGRRPHWRFRLSSGTIEWQDQIRGDTSIDLASLSDPVLIRSDGQFLYMLCSVVDDADMDVDLIIRGDDHVANAAQQLDLTQALAQTGFITPAHEVSMAHHSMLTDSEGKNLSKRLGSLAVEQFRKDGLQPEALVSLLARLGSASPIEPILHYEKLIDEFDLSIFSRAPANFSEQELARLNSRIVQMMDYEMVAGRLAEFDFRGIPAQPLWEAVQANIGKLPDIEDWIAIVDGHAQSTLLQEDKKYFKMALDELPERPWGETTWGEWTNNLKSISSRKGRDLFLPLRVGLTGRRDGPEMAKLLPLFTEQAINKITASYA